MESIEDLLPLASKGVLSLVGAGGKTSLMFHLAKLLARGGRRVLTTTTTKIFFPTHSQSSTVLVATEPEAVLRQAEPLLEGEGHITAAAAHIYSAGKLQGFAPEAVGIFAASGLFDWIIVEADGAARRPLKAATAHEPVIPAETTVVVAVAGLEVLGRPLTESLVFRSELAGERMGVGDGELIDEAAMVRLFSHPCGAFKGAPFCAARFIFLNKADTLARCEDAARIAALLREGPGPVAEALIVGQAVESIRVHASYPLGGGP